MGKLYVPSQTLTPLDRVREALDRAESGLSGFQGAGSQALELLHLCDQIANELGELDRTQADVRAERVRFEMVQGRLRRSGQDILREFDTGLRQAREQVQPDPSHWWWYLDDAVVSQRRRTLLRAGAGAVAAIGLLAVAVLAYQRFLAPPPEVGQAFRRFEAGRDLVEAGNLHAALEDFAAAADLTPDDPEPWLWQGVVYDRLGDAIQAEHAFQAAQPLFETTLDFYLSRGRAYLESGQTEQAELDAQRAMVEDPGSGWAYYLQAAIEVDRGDHEQALEDLDQAAELGKAAADYRLEALARTQRSYVMRLVPLPDPTQ
jgi:tetratricopeptide (TPR) repeat protein